MSQARSTLRNHGESTVDWRDAWWDHVLQLADEVDRRRGVQAPEQRMPHAEEAVDQMMGTNTPSAVGRVTEREKLE
jgi:hypothetical protein